MRSVSIDWIRDSLIAGIVLANDGVLLTRNRRHFERVADLTLSVVS
jgi:predicted nucleic acid-binding protein